MENKRIKFLMLGLVVSSLFVGACGGTDDKGDDDEDTTSTVDPDTKNKIEHTQKIVYSVPAPTEMANILENAGAKYNYKLLVVAVAVFFHHFKPHILFFTLRPFNKFAFKIGFHKKNFFNIHMKFQDAVQNKILYAGKSFVYVNRTNERLKCISMHGRVFQPGIVCLR